MYFGENLTFTDFYNSLITGVGRRAKVQQPLRIGEERFLQITEAGRHSFLSVNQHCHSTEAISSDL